MVPNKNIDMFLTCVTARDGVNIHHTVNHAHTAGWLVAMMRKEAKGELRGQMTDKEAQTGYLQTLSTNKLKNAGTHNQFTRMLMAIDGVSAERANGIVEKYPTCSDLVAALGKNKKDFENDVANIQIKKRRLGPSVAKNVTLAFL